MANAVEFQHPTATVAHWYTPTKQPDGIVVVDAFFDATYFSIEEGVFVLVQQPSQQVRYKQST